MQKIESAQDIWKLVQKMGFLPLFQNEIKGFSIEEHTPPASGFRIRSRGRGNGKAP